MVDKKLYATLDEDPMLLQQVSNVGKNQYKKIVDSVHDGLIDAEKKATANWTPASLSKLEGKLKSDLRSLAIEAEAKMEKETTSVVNRLRKVRSDQNLSIFVIGFSIAVSLAGIGMHVATLVTTPFTGGVGCCRHHRHDA